LASEEINALSHITDGFNGVNFQSSMVPDDLTKLLLSLVLGGLIGWERELYDKPAGFRTNTLICVGATLFTIFSLRIGTIPGNRLSSYSCSNRIGDRLS
jgi:uncharacterized membrane protein YhiD involved in acid resistance